MASLKYNGEEVYRLKFERVEEGFVIQDEISIGARGFVLRKRSVDWLDGEVTRGKWKRWRDLRTTPAEQAVEEIQDQYEGRGWTRA